MCMGYLPPAFLSCGNLIVETVAPDEDSDKEAWQHGLRRGRHVLLAPSLDGRRTGRLSLGSESLASEVSAVLPLDGEIGDVFEVEVKVEEEVLRLGGLEVDEHCKREVDVENERDCAGRSARGGGGDGLPRWLWAEIWWVDDKVVREL